MKHTYRDRTIDGSTPAVCSVCVATQQNLQAGREVMRVPKRAHHKSCIKNRKTKGMSEQSVFVLKEAQRMKALNRAPIGPVLAPTGVFTKCTSSRAMAVVPKSPAMTAMAVNFADPKNLRLELDARLIKLNKNEEFGWANGKRYPASVGLMIDYILSTFEHRRKPKNTSVTAPNTTSNESAIDVYRQFFKPGELEYKFCVEVNDQNQRTPSPAYHALEGYSFMLLDWKLAFPSARVCCFNCLHACGVVIPLEHDRHNFSKSKTLFALWGTGGRPTWCVTMNYKCSNCATSYAANDGRLLSVLDPDVASAYPVEPKYASGNFHFHRDATDDLEILLKTYANGKIIRAESFDIPCTIIRLDTLLDESRVLWEYLPSGG
jgi:hypothetical protein